MIAASRTCACGLFLFLVLPATGVAQVAARGLPDFPEEGSLWASYGLATALGAAGFVAGAVAAADAAGGDCDDLGCLEAAFYGGAVLGTFGVALGAHLGNRSRGNLALDLATAAGIWGLGIGPLLLGGDSEGTGAAVLFVAVPIAQVIVATAVDRSVGRKKEREHNERFGLLVLPTTDGGIALLGRLTP